MTPTRRDPPELSEAALLPGAVFVHRATGYLFRLDAVTDATLRFAGVSQMRMLELSRDDARAQLRACVEPAVAGQLEGLLVHEAAAPPDPELDLLLYLRGTNEQVAAAIAMMIDRATEGSDRARAAAASDLRFMGLKLLGELAWVRAGASDLFGRTESSALRAYETELRERRAAAPAQTRRRTVPAPRVPIAPDGVLTDARVNEDGWHVLDARLAAGEALVAASIGHGGLEVHERIGASAELFVTTSHRDGGVVWIVLAERAPATLAVNGDRVHAAIGDAVVELTRGAMHEGQTLIVVQQDHPPDLFESIEVRLRYPQRQVLVWSFALAAQPGMDGWILFTGAAPDGRRVWAFLCAETMTG